MRGTAYLIGRVLCLLGLHPLWTNVYGPFDCIFTCVRCRRQKYVRDW